MITLSVKTLNGSGVFRSIFCHCKVGHFIVGQVIGVLSSLIASSMYGERSEPRENGTCEQAAKPRKAILLKIFISGRLEEAQYHWLKNVAPSSNFDL